MAKDEETRNNAEPPDKSGQKKTAFDPVVALLLDRRLDLFNAVLFNKFSGVFRSERRN